MEILNKIKIYRNKKSLDKGYQIESPDVFVSWDTSTNELITLLKSHSLNRVTDEYFTVECNSLGGMKHKLGFHFEKLSPNRLYMLEFFRDSYPDYNQSFNEFQKHLEMMYGKATKEFPINSEGFPSYEWRIRNKIRIQHYIMDRFGLEERLFIQRAI